LPTRLATFFLSLLSRHSHKVRIDTSSSCPFSCGVFNLSLPSLSGRAFEPSDREIPCDEPNSPSLFHRPLEDHPFRYTILRPCGSMNTRESHAVPFSLSGSFLNTPGASKLGSDIFVRLCGAVRRLPFLGPPPLHSSPPPRWKLTDVVPSYPNHSASFGGRRDPNNCVLQNDPRPYVLRPLIDDFLIRSPLRVHFFFFLSENPTRFLPFIPTMLFLHTHGSVNPPHTMLSSPAARTTLPKQKFGA